MITINETIELSELHSVKLLYKILFKNFFLKSIIVFFTNYFNLISYYVVLKLSINIHLNNFLNHAEVCFFFFI